MNYCLMATYKCNWHCPYCITNTHMQEDVKDSEILKKLNEIKEGSEVSLSGGEPGLLSKENLNIIFKVLVEKKCLISVNTNGLFFKNHPEFDELIDNYLFHFSENLELDKVNYIPTIDHRKISFMLVVTDENYPRLDEFLEKHKDIRFSIFAAVQNNSKTDKKYSLSKINAFKIYTKYKDILDPESFKNLLITCKHIERNKELIRL